MLSLNDFVHPTVWGQALLFSFPTYLGAKTFAGRERQLYLALTVAVTMFSMFLGAMAQHDSDEELTKEASATVALQQKLGRLSGEGAFPMIEPGLTTKDLGRLEFPGFPGDSFNGA